MLILNIPVNNNVIKYAVELVNNTRPNREGSSDYINKYINFGAGPRASQYLVLGAKAKAALDGNPTPSIDDVNSLVLPILRHRVLPNFNAETEGLKIEDILNQLIENFSK